MPRLIVRFLVAFGALALVTGGTLLFRAEPVRAQEVDFEDAAYIGGRECRSCHRDQRSHNETPHALALQDVADDDDKARILGDFSQGEAIPLIQFPGESQARPLTPNDIVFAVGAGRHVQRYLYEVERREHLILPVQWNVADQAWEPYTLADTWPDPAYAWEPNCAGCHTTGLETERFRWEDEGVQCEACHGPGELHADAVDKAGRSPNDEELQQIRGLISLSLDPQICGQCHSRGTEPNGSFPYPQTYRPGQALTDDSIFMLVPPDDEAHWWPTGHASQANMQFNEWLESAHAGALETMRASENADETCLACHSGDYRHTQAQLALYETDDREGDPPEPLTLTTASYGVVCATCHSAHSASAEAPRPDKDMAAVCLDCHTMPDDPDFLHHPVREMFVGEALIAGIEGVAGAHGAADDGPTCVTCHAPDVPIEVEGTLRSSHTLKPVIPVDAADSPPGTCAECHTDLTATDMGYLIDDTQEAVRTRLTVAFARLNSIVKPDPASAAREQYDRAAAALMFVQNDGSMGVHNYVYTDSLLNAAETLLNTLSRPGSILQPTEAPAPTTIPSQQMVGSSAPVESVPNGIRPMTIILVGAALTALLIAAFVFFRHSENREV